jgi:hypothetical protein
VEPDDIGIIFERRLFYGAAQDFVDPPQEVSFQRFVVAIKDESSDPVRDSLGELLRHFLACSAIDVLPFRSFGRVHRIPGHPAAITALRYRSLTVTALLAHPPAPPSVAHEPTMLQLSINTISI